MTKELLRTSNEYNEVIYRLNDIIKHLKADNTEKMIGPQHLSVDRPMHKEIIDTVVGALEKMRDIKQTEFDML
jgi:hypothetical protein